MTHGLDVALVLLAAVLHASWNALVKSGSDRLLTQATLICTGSLIALLFVPFVPLPGPEAWPFVILSTVIHTVYYALLVAGYERGDLSQVYPIARGTGPLLVAVLAAPLAGEALGWIQIGGVTLASVGIFSLAFAGDLRDRRAIGFALATGVFIAAYTLVDGIGVRRSTTSLSFIVWLFLLSGLPLVALVPFLRRGKVIGFLRREWHRGVMGGVIATVGYSMIVWAMSRSGLAHVASLRETSVIIAALIGTLLLGEAGLARRLGAAICVVLGNLLLHIG